MKTMTTIGICSTCRNAPTCVFLKNAIFPVWNCEEFKPFPSRTTDHQSVVTRSESKKTENFKGLCSNCDKRHECRYLKPETGVWHCEEYE